MSKIREIIERNGLKHSIGDNNDFWRFYRYDLDKLEKELEDYMDLQLAIQALKEEGDVNWESIKKKIDAIKTKGVGTDWESVKYNSLCARATLYPGKTLEEVQTILDKLYPDETKSSEARDHFADSE